MANYKTPGVYIEEIPKFPPSVAQVETAIPAFIGYTAMRKDASNNDLAAATPLRIGSLKEYERHFGLAPRPAVTSVSLDTDKNFVRASLSIANYLYDSVRLFYANGGGDCYIVSIGAAAGFPLPAAMTNAEFTDGIDAVAKLDEPTILLFPEGVHLAGLHSVVQPHAMLQCETLKDRVTVCDLKSGDANGATFRSQVGINNLKYGMAYTPWLRAALPKNISYQDLDGAIFSVNGAAAVKLSDASITTDANIADLLADYDTNLSLSTTAKADIAEDLTALQAAFADYLSSGTPANTTDLAAAFSAIETTMGANTPAGYAAAKTTYTTALTAYQGTQNAANTAALEASVAALVGMIGNLFSENMEQRLLASFALYKAIVAGINDTPVDLPPSGAVVGVYAYVDRTRGVWKAPANVSLNSVLAPTVAFTESQLAALNVDVNAGKSINAIRQFTGKGTLIFGARTLAGNDNEWRYVPVRRFYNMVEESVKKACEQFVFEPNDANTWIRVRAMIENFLTLQWRAGALQGAKAEHAFFVQVGLGTTMTAVDILEGRMIVEIGMAPVRPAEFIILRFSQKMAES
jgi:hypothetical protein